MNFIVEFGFDVKQGKAHDFQKWLSENEGKIAAACPPGVEYVGTFGVIYSSEKHSGGYRQFFSLESYGDAGRAGRSAAGRRGFRNLDQRGDRFC